MATVHHAVARVDHVAAQRLPLATLAAAAGAAIANSLVFFVAQTLLGIPFVIPFSPGVPPAPLPLSMVISTSALPAIGATVLLLLLNRFVARPIRVFRIVSLVVLVVSLLPPLSLPVQLPTRLALSLMHIVAALVIAGTLSRVARRQA